MKKKVKYIQKKKKKKRRPGLKEKGRSLSRHGWTE